MNVIDNRQTAILSAMLKLMVIFGSIAFIPSLFACFYEGLYLLAVIDTICYAALISAYLGKLHYIFRLIMVLFVSLVLGGAVLFYTGTDGAGYLWLIFAVFIAALFGKRTAIVLTVSATQGILLLYVVLNILHILNFSTSLLGMLTISANMLIISGTVAYIVNYLLKSLTHELGQREKLLRLLRHRIMNNLQTLESLVSLEKSSGIHSRDLQRRIEALSTATGLLLEKESRQEVALPELLRLLARDIAVVVSDESDQTMMISAERLTEMTIGFSDLLNALKPYGPVYVRIRTILQISTEKNLPPDNDLNHLFANCLMPESWLDRNHLHGTPLKIDLTG